jgi:hypothetical protein
MVSTDVMVKKTLSTGIKSVLILGGEPFLFPKQLFEYVYGIRSAVKEIYVTTSLPENTLTNLAVFGMLDGVNVSIQSLYWHDNNKIMNASSGHNRIALLAELLERWPDKVRVNLNLVKGNIDSRKMLISALGCLKYMGCRRVKINELQHSSALYVSFEEIMGTKLPSPFASGCQTSTAILGIPMEITLKRSCFLVEQSRQASIKDMVKAALKRRWKYTNRFAVLYEDGMLSNGWMKEVANENNKSI